jgi:hypothetical protein
LVPRGPDRWSGLPSNVRAHGDPRAPRGGRRPPPPAPPPPLRVVPRVLLDAENRRKSPPAAAAVQGSLLAACAADKYRPKSLNCRKKSRLRRISVFRGSAAGPPRVTHTRVLCQYRFGRVKPNSVAFRPFSGRFPPKHAPGMPGFGHTNRFAHTLACPRCT